MRKIFLLIHSKRIGGAERRFFDLWLQLSQNNCNYFLVLSEDLFNQLIVKENISNKQVIFFNFELSTAGFAKTVKFFIKQHTERNDIVHFIIDCPIIYTNRKTIYSITQSSLSNINWKGKLAHIFGILFSNYVDVLDPTIFRAAKKWRFFDISKISITSCSFCDTQQYMPKEKENWVVFLGRFFEPKQVIPFVNAIPGICEKCKELKIEDVNFFILGHGEQEKEILELLQQPSYNTIPITFGFDEEPYKILNKSKVFLSLQKKTNYPSRSLIEALSAGNVAVVTDNGETRWLAKPEFSFYVKENFNQNELINAVTEVLALSEVEFNKRSILARNFIIHNHNKEKMSNYFQNCYNKISKSAT